MRALRRPALGKPNLRCRDRSGVSLARSASPALAAALAARCPRAGLRRLGVAGLGARARRARARHRRRPVVEAAAGADRARRSRSPATRRPTSGCSSRGRLARRVVLAWRSRPARLPSRLSTALAGWLAARRVRAARIAAGRSRRRARPARRPVHPVDAAVRRRAVRAAAGRARARRGRARARRRAAARRSRWARRAPLLRPEVWPLLALYGLWLWSARAAAAPLADRRRGRRAGAVARPGPARLRRRARPAPRGRAEAQAARRSREALEALGCGLDLVLAALWVVRAGYAVYDARRGRERAIVVLAAGAVAWIAIVVGMALLGFAGLPRFAAPAAAIACVLGGGRAGADRSPRSTATARRRPGAGSRWSRSAPGSRRLAVQGAIRAAELPGDARRRGRRTGATSTRLFERRDRARSGAGRLPAARPRPATFCHADGARLEARAAAARVGLLRRGRRRRRAPRFLGARGARRRRGGVERAGRELGVAAGAGPPTRSPAPTSGQRRRIAGSPARAVGLLVGLALLVVGAVGVDRPDVVARRRRRGSRPRASRSASSGRSCCSGAGRCGRPAGAASIRSSQPRRVATRCCVVGVVDRIGLRHADDVAADHALAAARARARSSSRAASATSSSSVRVPELVALEAEVLEPDAGALGLGDHLGAPGAEVLDPPDPDRRVVDVDPVVGERVGALEHQRDGEEVAVAQPGGRLEHRRGRARARRSPRASAAAARRSTALGREARRRRPRPRPRRAAVLIACHRRAERDLAAARGDLGRHPLPHLPGPEPRVVELLDQAADRRRRRAERGPRRAPERQPADPLRRPLGADLARSARPRPSRCRSGRRARTAAVRSAA